MAKKQVIVKENVAAAAPRTARAAKPKTPRVTAAKHSKAASVETAEPIAVPAGNTTEVIAKMAYGYWE